MKRHKATWQAWMIMTLAATALASEAETSASAGSRRGQRHGQAAASAHYEGDVGFARTQSRSGRVSAARGVAVGVDEDGMSLSVSQAIAPARGPAVATNFNLSIGRDGRVSGSTGLSVTEGLQHRSASAGGFARADRYRGGSASYASGRSDPRGSVRARTDAFDARPRIVRVRGHRHRHPVSRPVRILRPARSWRP